MVGFVVSCGVCVANELGVGVQEQGGFQLTTVHVVVTGGFHTCVVAGGVPVLAPWKQEYAGVVDVGLLGDVGQDVVAAVPVDQNQLVDAGSCQRGANVIDDGDQGGGADADRAGEPFVLMGTGDGHRWQRK